MRGDIATDNPMIAMISGHDENIPLLPDLSNAIIATCKGTYAGR
tara:strand:+ start:285 stop:416 length:132 start_codon:yes stop_codon:yes gene_type:complete